MRVLVTGAGGFLAGHLIPALHARNHEVAGLVLDGEDAEQLRTQGVEVYRGDVRKIGSLIAAMRGARAVFHLAAAIGVRRPMAEYEAVNIDGTRNVCEAALAAGVARLVHVSTTSVYAQGLSIPVTEEFPMSPLPDPYAVTKAKGDALVQEMIRDAGLPACIVRTSTFYGPGDRLNFGRIADRVRRRKAIVIGSGSNSVPFTYVSDVVDGLLLALDSERAVGQVYNVVDDSAPTQQELLDEIALQVGAEKPRIHVPYLLLHASAHVAERIAAVTGSPQAMVTRFGVALYGADNRYSIAKARRDLGFQPRVSFREGVRLAADWYRRGIATQRPVALAR